MNLMRCRVDDDLLRSALDSYLSWQEADEEPVYERQYTDDGDYGEPEPKEYEYLLIEHVDHEHALHRMMMYIAQHTHLHETLHVHYRQQIYLEIAHGDAWEVTTVLPLFAC